jgi:hypothetical protein
LAQNFLRIPFPITGIAMDNTLGGIIALGGLCYGFRNDPINLVDGTKINTDPNSEDFKNNSTTKEYRIKEGYEIIKSE